MRSRPRRPRRLAFRLTSVSLLAGRIGGRLAGAALVAFHGWLLWTHVLTGRLSEPQVILRWAAAGAIVLAFAALRRVARPLFRDRRAAVLWLLVVLLHGHAAWTGDASLVASIDVSRAVAELIPAGFQVAALSLFTLALWLTSGWQAAAARRPRIEGPALFAGFPTAVVLPRFSPRPPPLL